MFLKLHVEKTLVYNFLYRKRSFQRPLVSIANAFTKVEPENLAPIYKNRLAGQNYLPGSKGHGIPEFLAAPRKDLPYAVQAVDAQKLSVKELASACQNYLDSYLSTFGHVLFRGLPLDSGKIFSQFTSHLKYTPKRYEGGGGNRPRFQDEEFVYLTTNDPPEYTIELHNEMAGSNVYPQKVLFFCYKEPREGCGGLTPIASNREILAKLDQGVVRKLEDKKLRYYRCLYSLRTKNLQPWQKFFAWEIMLNTEDPQEVEQFFQEHGYEYEWENGTDILRFWITLPAFLSHPVTGEKIWFNQPTAHHSSYGKANPLLEGVDIPNNRCQTHCTYGDGSEIEPEVLQHIRAKSWQSAVGFQWKKGDLLVLDNFEIQHGRLAFTGERKILTYLTKD